LHEPTSYPAIELQTIFRPMGERIIEKIAERER
jgi:hypothetical protein